VCRDSARSVGVEESFHGFRASKVQEGQRPARSTEVEESFEDSKRIKLRRESDFMQP
jgi:hypothetical protein